MKVKDYERAIRLGKGDVRTFGDWMLLRRMESEITSEELGKKLRITQSTISCYETGRIVPSFSMVFTLCALFGNRDDPEEIYAKYVVPMKKKES